MGRPGGAILTTRWGELGREALLAARRLRRSQGLYGSEVSADFFPLLGAAPLLRRVLTAADARPGATPAVVLGNGLWRRRFGGDRRVLGRVVRLDDLALTVVGVMPPEFSVPLHLR